VKVCSMNLVFTAKLSAVCATLQRSIKNPSQPFAVMSMTNYQTTCVMPHTPSVWCSTLVTTLLAPVLHCIEDAARRIVENVLK